MLDDCGELVFYRLMLAEGKSVVAQMFLAVAVVSIGRVKMLAQRAGLALSVLIPLHG